MSTRTVHARIFKQGSRTYYHSSLFFPPEIRREVFVLYGFVRRTDDFVDRQPQDEKGFAAFKELYLRAERGEKTGDVLIDAYVGLARRKAFDPAWTAAFLESMEMDLTKSVYRTLEEILEYVYGSAEVIGLFMSRIMGLPEEAFYAARMQGRAMQYINFIRDVKEDADLGRRYLPLDGAPQLDLGREPEKAVRENFRRYMREQIDRYVGWQRQAEEGYRFIPRRFLIPVKTAADMYRWTADRIWRDPLAVYRKKVKPRKTRILLQALWNSLTV